MTCFTRSQRPPARAAISAQPRSACWTSAPARWRSAALAGVPYEARQKLLGKTIPPEVYQPLLAAEFQISRSYLIRYDRLPAIPRLDEFTYTPRFGARHAHEWVAGDRLIVPIPRPDGRRLGFLWVDDPDDEALPSFDTVQALEVLAGVAGSAIQDTLLFADLQAQKDANERLAWSLHRLHQVGAAAQAMPDLPRALHVVLGSLVHPDGLRFSHASLFLLDDTDDGPALMGRRAAGDLSSAGSFPAGSAAAALPGETLEGLLRGLRAGETPAPGDADTAVRAMWFPVTARSSATEPPDAFAAALRDGQPRLAPAEGGSQSPAIDRLPAGYARVFRPATATAIVPLQVAGSTLGLLVCDRSGSGASMDGSVGELLNYAALCADLIERDRLTAAARAQTAVIARRDAVTRERSRLESDLHDVKNILSARVGWELEELEDAVTQGDIAAAGRVLSRLRPVLSAAVSDLELALDDLRDQVLEREGLGRALAARAASLGRDKVVVTGALPDDLPPAVESLLLRVCVEGVNNALKHSGVTDRSDGRITVRVEQFDGAAWSDRIRQWNRLRCGGDVDRPA